MNKHIHLLLLLVLSTATLGCTSEPTLPEGSDLLPFVSHDWKSDVSTQFSKDDFVTPRQKMLKDVVEKVVLNGSKESILEQLGPSTDTQYFVSTGRDLVYYLGPELEGYMGNIDSEWLLIWFGEDGKLSKYEIARD